MAAPPHLCTVHRVLRRARPALLCLAILATGCASLGGLDERPRVSIVALKPVKIGLLEQRYSAKLRIQNPNKVALGVQGLDYLIEVNGREFASGVSDAGVEIPAFGEAMMEVSLTSNLASLLRQIKNLQREGSPLGYSISGRIAIRGIPGTIPFSHEGDLQLGAVRAAPSRTAA